MHELLPHPVYDFFAPGPLPDYDGNPNNTNRWIEADVPLLGELGEMGEPLGAEVDEPMVDLVIDELTEPIAALVVVKTEEQVIAPEIDVEEDLAMLFGDDDFSDDDSEGFEDDEEVCKVNEEWLMAPVTPPSVPVMPPSSTYEVGGPSTAAAEGHSLTLLAPGVPVPLSLIEDLCTRMGNLEYGHGQLVKKVIKVSDAEVADGIAIGEIGPRVSAIEGQMLLPLSVELFQLVNPSHVYDTYLHSRHTRKSWKKMVRRLDDEIPRNRIPTLRRDLLKVVKFSRWVEAKVVSSEVESEEWRRLLLHQMCVAIDIATD
ncbi:hypothetical protein Tco_1325705, partial [Tanacetum coccineum]